MSTETFDVSVQDHGTLHTVKPETEEADAWLRAHTDGTWWGPALVVEPRYAVDLLLGMKSDGFRIPLERRAS